MGVQGGLPQKLYLTRNSFLQQKMGISNSMLVSQLLEVEGVITFEELLFSVILNYVFNSDI